MSLLNKYLSRSLSSVFFPIFLTLFAITSVIYLVKIAALTSIIKMSFTELIYLYSLNVPFILYYSLPITIFISIIINLSKLSAEYELIVLTSFGLSPIKIMKLLIPIALLTSVTLFTLSFIVMPIAEYLQESFISKKKQEAQFNIQAGEYGQKFGPWYIHVKEKKENEYKDIVLFQTQKDKDIFILADNANVITKDNTLGLNLEQGSAFTISTILNQIDFANMTMSNNLKKAKKISSLNDIFDYWSNSQSDNVKKRLLMKNAFISMLPIISLLLYVSLGYFNPRYQKNHNTMYAILLVVFYVIVMEKMASARESMYLIILPTSWLILSYFLYLKKIKKIY